MEAILKRNFALKAGYIKDDRPPKTAMPTFFAFSFFCSSGIRQENTVNYGLYAGAKEDRKDKK